MSQTPEMHLNRVLIHPNQDADFHKRLKALNRKAERLGLPFITVQKTTPTYWKWHSEASSDGEKVFNYLKPLSDADRVHELHPVLLNSLELSYPMIKLGNWQVVGKLEAFEGGNLQYSVTPDQQDKAKLFSIAQEKICCDHCSTNRKRKDSFLLKDTETGDYKQVGNSCLEDFTGIDPSAALFLAHMSSLIHNCDEDRDHYAGGMPSQINTDYYLAMVARITEQHGFISRSKAFAEGYPSTSDDAISIILSKKFDPAKDGPQPKHLEKAKAIREWVKSLDGTDSFNSNVKLILAQDHISIEGKQLGFAAATIPQYNRTLEQAATKVISNHVGNAGDKMTEALTIKGIISYNSQYGLQSIVKLADAAGNMFKWKTASCPDGIRDNQGKTFEGQFKIKGHDEYKGIKETAITHLKVLEWKDLEPAPEAQAEAEPLNSQEHFAVVARADDAALQDWSQFFSTSKHSDTMPMLKDYAEQALESGVSEIIDTFTERLYITPHNFCMHYDHLSELYSKYQVEQQKQDAFAQEVKAQARTFTMHADNDAPAPF